MGLLSVTELPQRLRDLPGAGAVLDAVAGVDEEVYAVGGTVRDLWRGESPLDLDLVVVGDVMPLAGRLDAAARLHDRFGTATLRGADGVRYDLARARRETYAQPGALPEVAPAGIRDDLARRDFTVNALALGLSGPQAGRLLRAPHAAEDLAAGRLRVLHGASFRDDPTRLLRLARYASRLGFSIEPRTEALARTAIAAGALETVSASRIGAELELLGAEPDPVAAWQALGALGIDAALMPGLGLRDPALTRRALRLLPADGDPDLLVLGAAARGLDVAALRDWLHRLGLPAARRDVVLAVTAADGLAAALQAAASPAATAAAAGAAPPEAIALAGALGPEDGARAWLQRLRHVSLDLSGDDLLAAGLSPGPTLGRALRAALAAKLDGRADTRAAQLAEALRAAGAEG